MKKLFFAIAVFSTLIASAQTSTLKTVEKQKSQPQSHASQTSPATTHVETSDGRSITINVSGNVYAPITIVLDRGNANVQPAVVGPQPIYQVPYGCNDSIPTVQF